MLKSWLLLWWPCVREGMAEGINIHVVKDRASDTGRGRGGRHPHSFFLHILQTEVGFPLHYTQSPHIPQFHFFLFYFTLRKGRDAIYPQAAMMGIFSSVIRKAGFWTSLPHRAVWGENNIIWRRILFEACTDPLCSKSMPHFHCEPPSRQIYCLLAEAVGKSHQRGGHLPSGNVGVWAGWGQGPWGDVLLHSFPLYLILLCKQVLPGLKGLSIVAWEEDSGVCALLLSVAYIADHYWAPLF